MKEGTIPADRLMDIINGDVTVEEVYEQATGQEVKWQLTEWGVMKYVLDEYGINTDHITGKMGQHIVEDFMEEMVKAGYVGRTESK